MKMTLSNLYRWAAILPLIFVASFAFAQDSDTKYTYDDRKYAGNAGVFILVRLNGNPIDCEVAAFNIEDDECRGAEISIPYKNEYRNLLVVQGELKFTMYFRVVFTIDGIEYDVRPTETCEFFTGEEYGSLKQPFIIDLTSATLTPTQGFGTFFDSKQSYLIPEGVTGFTYSMVDGKLVRNESYPSGSTLPKGTAVVLQSNSGSMMLVATEDEGNAPASKSLLFGTDDDTLITAKDGEKHYVLSDGSKEMGFYLAYDPNGDRSFINKAHEAYLALDPSQAVKAPKSFNMDGSNGGVVSGICGVECDECGNGSSQPFNLMGMPVGDDYKGIVIINGKKVLIQ